MIYKYCGGKTASTTTRTITTTTKTNLKTNLKTDLKKDNEKAIIAVIRNNSTITPEQVTQIVNLTTTSTTFKTTLNATPKLPLKLP